MSSEYSFDIVGRVNMEEVLNAVQQTMKEIHQRFDFKGSKSSVDLDKGKGEITLIADDDFKLKSLIDILDSKLVKRHVPLKALNYGKPESASGDTVRQIINLQQGISSDRAKDIVKLIKDMKLKKAQAEIQKDQVRVKSKSKDDLQAVINILKEKDLDFHMDFINYR